MEKGNNLKKKNCNKKFCYDCLQKSFPNYWENRINKDWKCPCCFNECGCNQCKKNLIKIQISENSNINQNQNEDLVNNKNENVKNKFLISANNMYYNHNNNSNFVYNDKVYTVDNSNIIVSKEICRKDNSGFQMNLNYANKSLIAAKESENLYDQRFNLYKDLVNNKKDDNENFDFRSGSNNNCNSNALASNCRTFNICNDKNKIESKIMKIVEKKSINTKPRNEYIPESMFLNLKRLREEYTNVYDKYKDSIKL